MTQATGTRDIRDSDGFVEAATMLVDFHREYDYPAPDPDFLAQHLSRLVESGDTSVLTFGTPAIGVAVLRFRTGTWTADLESYLAEFYIKPGMCTKSAASTATKDMARDRRLSTTNSISLDSSRGNSRPMRPTNVPY